MVQYIQGDIFKSPAQVLVNAVNTIGVMGKGIALEYKNRYPNMYDKYKAACEEHSLDIGKLMLCFEADHWILLFPTKKTWRQPSKYEYIEKGLKKFVEVYLTLGITSIAFPKLGCGNGELDWVNVKEIMEKYLSTLPINIYIYEKDIDIVPEHREPSKFSEWLKSNYKDLSLLGVEEELRYNYSIVPYHLIVDNKEWDFLWNDGIEISNSNTKYMWKLLDFQEWWDNVRRSKIIFQRNMSEKEEMLFIFMRNIGYFSDVFIYDHKENGYCKGYQINEWLDRYYKTGKKVV